MKVVKLGAVAWQALEKQGAAQVMGLSSRGLFLRTAADWVLFLSADPYRGPLTLNLDGSPGQLREQAVDAVAIRDGALWFPKSQLRLRFDGAQVWNPPPAGSVPLSPAERSARMDEVSRRVPTLDDLLDAGTAGNLAHALHGGQAEQAAGLLRPLLGRGPGLTPAGDDLVLGLLLALNRWGRVLAPGFPVETLNPLLVQDARARTTALSASLLACAAQGQADERLVRGLDGLVTGQPDASACARCFMEWGSTSGASAFAGMNLVAAHHLGA